MASLPVILEAARSTDKPFILAGDWNDTPDSPFIKAMAKEFEFCSSTQQATYPSDTPKDCIDYIAIYKRGREKTGPKQVWEGPFINEPAVVTSRTVGTDKVASRPPRHLRPLCFANARQQTDDDSALFAARHADFGQRDVPNE